MEREYFTITELAERLSLKVKAIYDLVYTKRIPYTKVGNRLRFQKELIDSWLKSKTYIPINSNLLYNKPKVEGEDKGK